MSISEELQKKIGQLFICGFEGKEVPEELEKWFREGRAGGAILFARNIGEPRELVGLTRSIAEMGEDLPLWISVDQEGGRVARLREPFTELPPASVLGRIDEESDEDVASTWAFRFGEILAEEAAAAGFNLIFAPVMDVHTNPKNPVIGDRALASEPERVARLGLAYAQGVMAKGVMPCAKHFPGHGDTALDSHLALPVVEHGVERLEKVEFLPFRAAVKASLPAIMSAHVLFPRIESQYPATLSVKILRNILRESWGFEGLLISDDLEMKGVADHFEIGEIVVKGLLAGIDLFLLCRDWRQLEAATKAIVEAIESGVLSEERIEESFERIVTAKERFASSFRGLAVDEIEDFLDGRKKNREDAAFLREWWKGKSPSSDA